MKNPALLQRDLFASSAARHRRRAAIRNGGITVVLLAAVIGLAFLLRLPNPPTTAATPAPVPPPPSAPASPMVEQIDDRQLLALLAPQGPVLLDLGDGRRQLILTRPAETPEGF